MADALASRRHRRILVRGGTVIDASGDRRADVLVEDGFVVAVEPDIDTSGAQILDAGGCLVSPGLVDLHCHIRQPGDEQAETIETGSRAAAVGGYTAVVTMPDLDSAVDSVAMVREVQALAAGALCDVYPAAAITIGRAGQQLVPFGELAEAGVRVFTDAEHSVQDSRVLLNALLYAGQFSDAYDLVIADRCHDVSLSSGGQMHEGEWSSRLGLDGIPAEAEEIIVERDIKLLRKAVTQLPTRLHLSSLSTRASFAHVREAKAEGLPITADAQPHYVSLTDAAVQGFDPAFKLDPPLRTDIDGLALRHALRDGTLDALASGHDPRRRDEKEKPFADASSGMVALETALAVALTDFNESPARVIAAMSWRPAAIASLHFEHGELVAPESRANLCVVDPTEAWTVESRHLVSRSNNTPLLGRQLNGKVRHTILRGEPVVLDAVAQR